MKEVFLKRMKDMLTEEYDQYICTLDEPAYRGIRVNLLKTDVETFQNEFPYVQEKTPFCPLSFYLSRDLKAIGNHPYHTSGLCYLQEPSAASAVEVLDVRKGDWVLDLCAAPGGKSTQIASYLQHTGCLLSNEIESSRAQILMSNAERMGIMENIITNTSPHILCEEVKGHFDKVLVDAPCSGEGMFKKNSQAMDAWSEEHVLACKHRQLHILDSAYLALKQDGILVYSTCTYAMEENEQVIYEFLLNHPDMELINCDVEFGRCGLPYKDLDVSKVRRIFPMDKGEGHFIAKMKRTSDNPPVKLTYEKEQIIPKFVEEFLQEQIQKKPAYVYQKQDQIFIKNTPFIKLKKSKIIRQGVMCGEVRRNRLEPHHHFYMSAAFDFRNKVELKKEEVRVFYSGNVIPIENVKGYCALTYQNHVIGFGKGDGIVIKNKLPKGLRCNIDENLF